MPCLCHIVVIQFGHNKVLIRIEQIKANLGVHNKSQNLTVILKWEKGGMDKRGNEQFLLHP